MSSPAPDRPRATTVVADRQDQVSIDPRTWGLLVDGVLDELGLGPTTEVSVTFVGEAEMEVLHQEHLGLPGPTDVLSFPIDGEGAVGCMAPAARPESEAGPRLTSPVLGVPSGPTPWMLGDVVVCPAVAARQAADHAGSTDDEIALLVVHGLLHLLGFDHRTEEQRIPMQAWEKALLSRHHGPLAGDPWAG